MTITSIIFDVCAKNIPRFNRIVSVDMLLNLDQIAGVHLEEIDQNQDVLDPNVPFQLIWPAAQDENMRLIFILSGKSSAHATRYFRLCLDQEMRSDHLPKPQVQVCEVFYQGQQAFHIQTPAATYLYHQQGGGLATLRCPDGLDWISYKPTGGSAGNYRGIPNIKYPEGYFHPGAKIAQSTLLAQGPLCCVIHTETLDGLCEAVWEFYPTYVTLNLLKAATPYWFLYEGTPDGKLDESGDYIVRSDGTQTPASQSWEAVLNPGWVYFGDAEKKRVLFFAQHDTEPRLSSYWPMEGNMTVFGFGRKDLNHYLEKVPARYTLGLLKAGSFDEVSAQIESARQDIEVTIREYVEA